MSTLAPCPCGKTPTDIAITPGYSAKHAMVTGNCCYEWHVEFRTEYKKEGTGKLYELAVEAWNEAERK